MVLMPALSSQNLRISQRKMTQSKILLLMPRKRRSSTFQILLSKVNLPQDLKLRSKSRCKYLPNKLGSVGKNRQSSLSATKSRKNQMRTIVKIAQKMTLKIPRALRSTMFQMAFVPRIKSAIVNQGFLLWMIQISTSTLSSAWLRRILNLKLMKH